MKRSAWARFQPVALLLIVVLLVGAALKHQAIQDWLKLRGYTAPATIMQLAKDDTMTAEAQHLFYVNHPVVTTGSSFTKFCPIAAEKTIVLGCYVGNDGGIYIEDVTDMRLHGVEEVTAAHEMLHAAYRRLSNAERSRVDAMLTDYYQHGLVDQRIKDTIAAYKKSEPDDVVNEMHSIFGTEIANLPTPLEHYYKQYFVTRAAVTDFTARYQQEFTSRQMQVAAYDTELATLKAQIASNEAQLSQQKAALDNQNKQLQSERSNGNTAAYNSSVLSYNAAVQTYNNLLATTKSLINQYNDIVNRRNEVALEEQQLVQALSPGTLPGAQ